MPDRLGVPEIAFEPDGDAGLEWWRGPDRVLTVSVGRNGELRYAARLNGARVIGTGMFADGLPKRLVETALKLGRIEARKIREPPPDPEEAACSSACGIP